MPMDKVNMVLVSQATARDGDGRLDTQSMQKALAECDEQLREKNQRIAQIQVRLAQLNRTVRGKRLPRGDYDKLCQEQDELRDEEVKLRKEAGDFRVTKTTLEREFKADGGSPNGIFTQALKDNNMILKQILYCLQEIRDRLPLPERNADANPE